VSIFVGIDVSKETLDWAVDGGAEAFRSPYDDAGLEALAGRLRELNPSLIVMEATGGLEMTLLATLSVAGLPVAVVNPRQVRDFARGQGILAKTDKVDARCLALFAFKNRPAVTPMPEAATIELELVLARRRQLVTMRVSETNRLGSLTGPRRVPRVLASIKRVIKTLDDEIGELDDDLDAKIKASPLWQAKDTILRSVPGVGPGTSRTLLLDLPELGTLDRKKIAALAGLAPINRDSGKSRGRRSIRGGRTTVRAMLYMACVTAVRCNPLFKALYGRFADAGKPHKVAMTACMHKLLTILNSMLRNNTPWAISA
jgi:transposase